jgi:hypothetical protein
MSACFGLVDDHFSRPRLHAWILMAPGMLVQVPALVTGWPEFAFCTHVTYLYRMTFGILFLPGACHRIFMMFASIRRFRRIAVATGALFALLTLLSLWQPASRRTLALFPGRTAFLRLEVDQASWR